MKSSSSMERVSVQETAQLAGGGQSATNVREPGETAWEIWILSIGNAENIRPRSSILQFGMPTTFMISSYEVRHPIYTLGASWSPILNRTARGKTWS